MEMLSALFALTTLTTTDIFHERSKDWRFGAVVYQVFIDRFAPPKSLNSKLRFIKPPRVMKAWSETPEPGHLIPELGLWSHELEFWGGDLESLQSKLDYIQSLRADVLYLTPIAQAFTNHRYDTQDYAKVDPALGSRQGLIGLTKAVHAHNMKIMLDGVFNHMGRTSELFKEAMNNTSSPHRKWFFFGNQYPSGYRAWSGAASLPVLRLENPQLRQYLWGGQNSIVRQYLQDGIDGWRLDVAFELGPKFLHELTTAAHATKPGSSVVGEISGYPASWFPSVDGVFNFFSIDVVSNTVKGIVSGGRAGLMLQHAVDDAGIENILKSWLLVDNHDTARLANSIPDLDQRKLVLAMQFTLPGCPVIYYGTELGMEGAGDPQNRAPMRWDLVTKSNPVLNWTKKLVSIRSKLPALKYGDFRALDSDTLIAFSRTTNNLSESVIVVSNPTNKPVTECFPTRIGRIMSWGELKDQLTGQRVRSITGNLTLALKPYQTMILTPITAPVNGVSPYNRVK